MLFCPFCGTVLVVQNHLPSNISGGCRNSLSCITCCYSHPIVSTLTVTHDFTSKNKEAISAEEANALFSAADASAETMQVTTIQCASTPDKGCDGYIYSEQSGETQEVCTSTRAYFTQVQMRSGDEGQTTFYKCVACGYQWKQD